MALNLTSLNFGSQFGLSPTVLSQNLLLAHVGEEITAQINFATTGGTSAYTHVEFWYQLVDVNSLQADYTYVANIDDTCTQKFIGAKNGILNPIAPKQWQQTTRNGVSCSTVASGNNFTITHRFVVNPLPQNTNDIPQEYQGERTVKYAFKIVLKTSELDTVALDTYVLADNVNSRGNVGFLNERYNGLKNVWDFGIWNNNTLNDYLDFTLVSETNQTAPILLQPCICRVLQDNLDTTKTFNENYLFDYTIAKVDNTNYSGGSESIIRLVKATLVNPKTINVKIWIDKSKMTGEIFNLWLIIGKPQTNEATIQRNSIFLKQFTADDNNTDYSPFALTLGQPTGAFFANNFAFFQHPFRSSNAFTQLKCFSQDTILARAKLEVANGFTLKEIIIEIKDDNNVVYEKQRIIASIETTKGYILAENDLMNSLNFDFTTKELEYAFKIRWEDWKSQNWNNTTNIRFCLTGILEKNGELVSIEYKSLPFIIKTYNQTHFLLGTLLNPALTCNIETFDSVTNENLSGNLSLTNPTKVITTFKGLTTTGIGYNLSDLYSIISVDTFGVGGVNTIREYSTMFSPESNTPFLPFPNTINLAQFTDYNMSSSNGDGTFGKVVVSCKLDYSKLPPANSYILSARLGQKQESIGEPIPPETICEPLGSFVSKTCVGNDLVITYNDGNCGTITATVICGGGCGACGVGEFPDNPDIPNPPTPTVCPAYGTIADAFCSGNTYVTTYYTGVVLSDGTCQTISQTRTCLTGCGTSGCLPDNPPPLPCPCQSGVDKAFFPIKGTERYETFIVNNSDTPLGYTKQCKVIYEEWEFVTGLDCCEPLLNSFTGNKKTNSFITPLDGTSLDFCYTVVPYSITAYNPNGSPAPPILLSCANCPDCAISTQGNLWVKGEDLIRVQTANFPIIRNGYVKFYVDCGQNPDFFYIRHYRSATLIREETISCCTGEHYYEFNVFVGDDIEIKIDCSTEVNSECIGFELNSGAFLSWTC